MASSQADQVGHSLEVSAGAAHTVARTSATGRVVVALWLEVHTVVATLGARAHEEVEPANANDRFTLMADGLTNFWVPWQ